MCSTGYHNTSSSKLHSWCTCRTMASFHDQWRPRDASQSRFVSLSTTATTLYQGRRPVLRREHTLWLDLCLELSFIFEFLIRTLNCTVTFKPCLKSHFCIHFSSIYFDFSSNYIEFVKQDRHPTNCKTNVFSLSEANDNQAVWQIPFLHFFVYR